MASSVIEARDSKSSQRTARPYPKMSRCCRRENVDMHAPALDACHGGRGLVGNLNI